MKNKEEEGMGIEPELSFIRPYTDGFYTTSTYVALNSGPNPVLSTYK